MARTPPLTGQEGEERAKEAEVLKTREIKGKPGKFWDLKDNVRAFQGDGATVQSISRE